MTPLPGRFGVAPVPGQSTESARTYIPEDEIHGIIWWSANEGPLVFLGRFLPEGDPEPLAPNIACLDYSVAKPGGKLVSYRWSGEQEIRRDKFIWVDRVEP